MSVTIDSERVGGVLVAQVNADSLETNNVTAFRVAIAPVLEQADQVVLDLSKVAFMDSTALGALLSCLRLMKAKGGSLRVASLAPDVKKLFSMVMMDRVFEIYPSAETAISA